MNLYGLKKCHNFDFAGQEGVKNLIYYGGERNSKVILTDRLSINTVDWTLSFVLLSFSISIKVGYFASNK